MGDLHGLLLIGDPHIASRPPGFRRDDYPRAILDKLRWCLAYAAEHALQPVLLGDLFHFPRDNANWVVGELAEMFRVTVPAVAGNHDLNENTLRDDDTLSILVRGGHLRLLDDRPWMGVIGGRKVIVGGTSWGRKLPESLPPECGAHDDTPLVFWITHHDIRFAGYEEIGRIRCTEIPGIAAVINGHIHQPLENKVCGGTTWINPGNISRVSRGDASRRRSPGALRINIDAAGWSAATVPVPHLPFDEVFHPEVTEVVQPAQGSLFISGLRQLETIRTGGAGLAKFLDDNAPQFGPAVAAEISRLAQEILNGDTTQ